MHFVPFPALTEAERVAGLAPFDPNLLRADPRAAIAASGLSGAVRVRAFARNDGPIYIVLGASGLRAFKGPELAPAGAIAAHDALAIAAGHARRRGITSDAAAFAELADYDQWTVSNRLDPHRPLYRIALNDDAATELYVSSTTGEVVRDTNARERGWNYVGSVAHWIYPTSLRRNLDAWLVTVWWLALAALIAAITGTIVGLWSVRIAAGRVRSPYSGWQAWHHWLGLGCTVFILTWTFSGWLSMDNGLLFSNGKLSPEETAIFSDKLAWQTRAPPEPSSVPGQVLEVEWFAFGERVYRRDRFGLDAQRLLATGETRSGYSNLPGTCRYCACGSEIRPGLPPSRCGRDDGRLPIAISHTRRAGLSAGVRRCLVQHRRGQRCTSGKTRWLAARISLALSRPAYAGLCAVQRLAVFAHRRDRRIVRNRDAFQRHRHRHWVAPLASSHAVGRTPTTERRFR